MFVVRAVPGFVTERFLFPSIGEYLLLDISLIKMASYYGWLAMFILAVIFITGGDGYRAQGRQVCLLAVKSCLRKNSF
jgi:hypothetical protein